MFVTYCKFLNISMRTYLCFKLCILLPGDVISYHIIYYPSVDLYRITKSTDIEIVTFLGVKKWDQHKVYNSHMVQYSFF